MRSGHITNSMKLAAKIDFRRAWTLWAAILVLTLPLSVSACDLSRDISRDSDRADASAKLPSTALSATPATNNYPQVRNYFMNFAGDHSLDLATVTEQVFTGYATYTVQLRLASGAEQSVVVSAPPGGLQIEMHDMTGDKVPNDLVLRPVLFRWLPTVFVNDGHDHFALAISGTDPRSFSSSGGYGSQNRDCQSFALLTSSGFKTVALAIHDATFGAQSQRSFVFSFTSSTALRLGHASSPGRAPPVTISI